MMFSASIVLYNSKQKVVIEAINSVLNDCTSFKFIDNSLITIRKLVLNEKVKHIQNPSTQFTVQFKYGYKTRNKGRFKR